MWHVTSDSPYSFCSSCVTRHSARPHLEPPQHENKLLPTFSGVQTDLEPARAEEAAADSSVFTGSLLTDTLTLFFTAVFRNEVKTTDDKIQ